MTERETELVIQVLNARPAVQSGSAVLPREIRDGNGPALVAEVRRRSPGQLSVHADSAPTPTPPQRAEQCGWCSRTGHDADNCPDRESAPAPEPPAAPADLGEPCVAGDRCLRPPSSADPDTGYHARCGAAAAARASLAAHAPATRGDLLAVEAAGQVAKARALRETPERAQSGAVAS